MGFEETTSGEIWIELQHFFCEEYGFQNVICKLSTVLSESQCLIVWRRIYTPIRHCLFCSKPLILPIFAYFLSDPKEQVPKEFECGYRSVIHKNALGSQQHVSHCVISNDRQMMSQAKVSIRIFWEIWWPGMDVGNICMQMIHSGKATV